MSDSEIEHAARVYAQTPRDGLLTTRLEEAFLAGVRWDRYAKKPRVHLCRVCEEPTHGEHYCDEHRYDPCVVCGKTMRRNGQKAEDHPGTVARNTKDTCASCYARARRAGEYTRDLAPDPRDVRKVTDLVNVLFTGNDRLMILNALGFDTQASVQ